MDIEQTTEQELLIESKKQTKAQEQLVVFAQLWSVLAAIGIVFVLIALFAASR